MELCHCEVFEATAACLQSAAVACVHVRTEHKRCGSAGLFLAMKEDAEHVVRQGVVGDISAVFLGKMIDTPDELLQEHGEMYVLPGRYHFRFFTAARTLETMYDVVSKEVTAPQTESKVYIAIYCDLDTMTDEDASKLSEIVTYSKRHPSIFEMRLRVLHSSKMLPHNLLQAAMCKNCCAIIENKCI